MTNQEILTKAIQKAIKNGYKPVIQPDEYYIASNGDHVTWKKGGVTVYKDIESIIYSHDFTKSLWGEEETQPIEYVSRKDAGGFGGGLTTIVKQGWQQHLQAMVIADDPIKYLGEHI